MAEERFSKNFFLGLLIVLLVLTLMVLYPLMNALLCAIVLAYFFYPVYKYCARMFRSKQVASFVLVIVLIILIVVPSYYITEAITKEGYGLFIEIKQKLATTEQLNINCQKTPYLFCGLTNKFVNLVKNPQVAYYIQDASSKLSSFIVNEASNFIISLPNLIIFFVVMFFSIYYFFIDGELLIEKMKRSIPLKKHHVDHIINQFSQFMHATLYGHVVSAAIQGILGALTYYLLGITTPILAGLAIAVFAFLPIVGSPLIWVPTAITLFIEGSTGKGVILLIAGLFIVTIADNFLRPMLIGKRLNIHPGVVLIGTLGGLFVMGPIGIIIGPLIISLFWTFVEVYYKEGFGNSSLPH